jgi:hypothetical protein
MTSVTPLSNALGFAGGREAVVCACGIQPRKRFLAAAQAQQGESKKVDLRSLRDQLNSRIDRLAEQTNNRFDGVIAKIDGLGDSVASARGFGWI